MNGWVCTPPSDRIAALPGREIYTWQQMRDPPVHYLRSPYLLHERLDLGAGVVPAQSHVALVPLPEVDGMVIKGVLGGAVQGTRSVLQPIT